MKRTTGRAGQWRRAFWLTAAVAGCGGGVGTDGAPPAPAAEAAPVEPACAAPPLPAFETRSEVIEDPATMASPRSVYAWAGRDDANLGVGHLILNDAQELAPANDLYYGWPRHAVFPLYDAPNGEHIGWFDRGWVVLGFGYDALHRQGSGAGQVETDYEHQTIVVLDTAPGGWYRIRHTEPRRDQPGTAWVQSCHLRTGPVGMSLRGWEDVFGPGLVENIYFRSEVRHSLRAAASADAERVAWIPGDRDATDITVLELAGDWMRVSVQNPSTWCLGEDAPEGVEVAEGWIKWRDDEKGPWIWWYTRGC
ncbi:MAG: hypothetical protein ABFS34_11475 [Gemmatimonadota bacterium]